MEVQSNSNDLQSLWIRRHRQAVTKVTSVLTPSTPVDHSDIGFDIDTSFSDMVVEGSSTRSPPLQEKRCLHLLLGLPYQIGVIHSSGDNPCSSVLDALWVSSDHEVQQSNPSLKIRNLPPIVLYPWPYILQAALWLPRAPELAAYFFDPQWSLLSSL